MLPLGKIEMDRHERSRSPLLKLAAPSLEVRERLLADFARTFWLPSDGPDIPPWEGQRSAQVKRFRDGLVQMVEDAADLEETFFGSIQRSVAAWQRFTFFEDLARMSEILFRGPLEPRHADDIDFRLHSAWRSLRMTIADPEKSEKFTASTAEYRVSVVRVAMMLETARPPEAVYMDADFELPDARTLASLLSLRCERDDMEELQEMYRLICHKLSGCLCAWCDGPFDESSSAGLFDGSSSLVIPATIPKVFVPMCGHAIHTTCFGSQLVPDRNSGLRGHCRRCGLPYAWSSIDVDPLANAFCLLFGPYVDKRTTEMRIAGEIADSAVVGIADICNSFSLELGGLLSAASAWVLLARRHNFAEPEIVRIVGEEILRVLTPTEDEVCSGPLQPILLKGQAAVICPEDRDDEDEDVGSCCSLESRDAGNLDRRHLTEVFLPADEDLNAPSSPDQFSEPIDAGAEEVNIAPPLPEDGFTLPEAAWP